MRTLLLIVVMTIGYSIAYSQISLDLNPDITCVCRGSEEIAPFNLLAEGTASPFNFKWDGPDSFYSGLQSPSIIHPGLYTVTVTNAYGCETILEAELETCSTLDPIQFQITPNCSSGGGNVTATIEDGEGDLDYEWSNGVMGEMLNNVPAGTYTLTVTDGSSCDIVGEVVVPVPEEPAFEIEGHVNHACQGFAGWIELQNLAEVTAPYTIQWSTGATDYRLDDLSNGDYSVTDANGCSNEATYEILSDPVYVYEVTHPTCNDSNDGRIELIESSGGNAQEVRTQWIDEDLNIIAEDELLLDNLAAGTYSVAIWIVQEEEGEEIETGCYTIFENIILEADPEQAAYPYLRNLGIRAINTADGTTSIIYQGNWIGTSAGCFEYMDDSENLDPMLVDDMSAGLVSWEVFAVFSEPVESGSIIFDSESNSVINNFLAFNPTLLTTNVTVQNVQSLVGTQGSFNISTNVFAFTTSGLQNLDMHTLSNGLNDCVVIPALDPVSCEYTPLVPADAIGQDPTHSFGFQCVELSLEPSADANSFCIDLGDVDFADISNMRIRRPEASDSAP